MSKKTTYEQLITKKLNDMPAPDMADAIWARIERQLDIDMPADDGDGDPDPKDPSGGGWMIGSGSLIFVAAFITIFLIHKNKNQTAGSSPSISTTIQKTDSVRNNNGSGRGPNLKMELNNKIFNNKQPELMPAAPAENRPVLSDQTSNPDTNSVVSQAIAPAPIRPDTLQQVNAVVAPPFMQDSIKPKKSRGVTGITDNDYRIVPANKESKSP